MRLLVYGYGNPARQDDGIAIKFIELLENWVKKNKIVNIDIDTNYQLNIEDAYTISTYDIVIFVDSTDKKIKNFTFKKLECNMNQNSFTTHSFSPETIIYLCKNLFMKDINAYLLLLKGYRWGYGNYISKKALTNLKKAFVLIKKIIKQIL